MNSREKMTQHLLQQRAQAMVGGSCRYRADNGLMCAVGCLIPDELYNPEKERGLSDLLFYHKEYVATWLPTDISEQELKDWQYYHDGRAYIAKTGESFSYGHWLEGDESQSPEEFAKVMEQQYGKIKENN